MRKIILISISSFLLLCGVFYLLMTSLETENAKEELIQTGMEEAPPHMVSILRINEDLSIPVELAVTDDEWTLGLSYRESLDEKRGMLFVSDGEPEDLSFWMYEMKFPLDILFLNGEEVVDIAKNVPEPKNAFTYPATVTTKTPANQVLEINAGKADEWGIQIGDRLVLVGN